MSKEVEVYNAYFGDCIILKDNSDKTNLLIDFGIHYYSDIAKIYGNRDLLTKNIADDLASKYSFGNTNLLITHFHEDHVSGLVEMYQSGDKKFNKLFNSVYLANIWNDSFAVASNILEEIVLIIQLKSNGLPRTKSNLLDVLDYLSLGVTKVVLLSRGVQFENGKYITLWPPKDISSSEVENIINELRLSRDFSKRLLKFSDDICFFVRTALVKLDEDNGRDSERITMDSLQSEFKTLLDEAMGVIGNHGSEDQISLQKNKLNKLNHKYNIVFQNKEFGDENILFTGDAEKEQMKTISLADDYKLHSKYKFIKVPHHGTGNHFFDFAPYYPDKLIISNGTVKHQKKAAYGICTGYGNIKARHICTNSDNCCSCVRSCKTSICNNSGSRELIFNRLSKVIS